MGKDKDLDLELKLTIIEKESLKRFFKKRKKEIIFTVLGMGIGALLVFFLSWVLVAVFAFGGGYLVCLHHFKEKNKENEEKIREFLKENPIQSLQ